MKQVLTSNSLFLVSSSTDSKDFSCETSFSTSALCMASAEKSENVQNFKVLDTRNSYWELTPAHGYIDKVRQIFQTSYVYDGPHSTETSSLLSYSSLINQVQASEAEIVFACEKLFVIRFREYNDVVFKLSDSFISSYAKYFFSCILSDEFFSENLFKAPIADAYFQKLSTSIGGDAHIFEFFSQKFFFIDKEFIPKNIVKALAIGYFNEKYCWPVKELLEQLEKDVSWSFTVHFEMLAVSFYF